MKQHHQGGRGLGRAGFRWGWELVSESTQPEKALGFWGAGFRLSVAHSISFHWRI